MSDTEKSNLLKNIDLLWLGFLVDYETNPNTKEKAKVAKQMMVALSPLYTVIGSLGLTLLSIQQMKSVLILLNESDELSPLFITTLAYSIGGIAYPIFAYRMLRSYRTLVAMINTGTKFWYTPPNIKVLKKNEKLQPASHLLFPLVLGLCIAAGVVMAMLTFASLNELYSDVSEEEQDLFLFIATCSGFAQGLNWLSSWSSMLLPSSKMPARLSVKNENKKVACLALMLTLPSLSLAIHRGQQSDESFDTAYIMLIVMVLAQSPSIARGWGFLLDTFAGNVKIDYKNCQGMWMTSAAFYTLSVFISSLLASHLLFFNVSLEDLLTLKQEGSKVSFFDASNTQHAAASTAQCFCASTGALAALGNRLRSLESEGESVITVAQEAAESPPSTANHAVISS